MNYFKEDLRHYVFNIPQSLVVTLFYLKFGFLGWEHLLSLFFIQYFVLPLDDWLDKRRPFPFYVVPMILFSFYFYPLITILALAGALVVNLGAIVKKKNFIVERLEGLGNFPIYALPILIPFGLNDFKFAFSVMLFILFLDSFHKISHRETSSPKLMWITGILFFVLALYNFALPNLIFIGLISVILLSLIPFWIFRKKHKIFSWSYYWIFQYVSIYFGAYYYLNYFV